MKKILLLIAIGITSLSFSQSHLQKPATAKALNDTILFDINQAVYTTVSAINYIEIPVTLVSTNTTINSFDFWYQFDVNKLTYVSTTSLISGLDAFSNFNSSNLYLSNTSSGTSITFNIPTNVPVIKLKFQLAGACTAINESDFYNITTLFNGDVSAAKFSAPTLAPIEILSPEPYCSTNYIQFSYPASINGKTISSYQWNFGNGDFSTAQSDSSMYAMGSYNVQLSVTTVDGCTYDVTKSIEIFEGPQAAFNYSVDQVTYLASFVNQSTIQTGNVVSFDWNFGDGTNASPLENPDHAYQIIGNYVVSLTVTSDNGCKNTIDSTIYVGSDGINELNANNVVLYPNPSTTTCEVNFGFMFNGNLTLIDAQGKEVFKKKIKGTSYNMDLQKLKSGTYQLNVSDNTTTKTVKVIKL